MNKNMNKNILIVTTDLMGPIRNGGVGTSCAHLADLMVEAGYSVEILLANEAGGEKTHQWESWVKHYLSKNIILNKLPEFNYEVCIHHWARLSYLVYQTIKDTKADVIVFPDMGGLAYYSLQAKKLGIAFQETKILLKFLGPLTWSKEDNQLICSGMEGLYMPMFERVALEFADYVQVATPWSLQWCKEQRWKLPHTSQMLFPLPHPALPNKKNEKFDELVFFGRLENRKGLDVFIEAVKAIASRGDFPYKKLTFLGRENSWTKKEILESLGSIFNGSVQVSVKTNLQSNEALEYLKGRPALAVILSKSETMGYTVCECLSAGIPFIASAIEPFSVLVGAKHKNKLVALDVMSIKEAILKKKFIYDPQRYAMLCRLTKKKWLTLIRQLACKKPVSKSKVRQNSVAVIMTHYNRVPLLTEALESLVRQTRLPNEILIYDDASTDKTLGRVIVHYKKIFNNLKVDLNFYAGKKNRGPSFGRNFMAKKAKSEFLLFMDDDNLAREDELEKLLTMQAHSGADVITMAISKFIHEQRHLWKPQVWTPLGFDLAASALENALGDTNSLIRKTTFDQSGGFIDNPEFKAEDMNLLMKIAIAGAKMFVCPEPLVNYRVHNLNRSHIRNRSERALHAITTMAHLQTSASASPQFSIKPVADFMINAAERLGSYWDHKPQFKPFTYDEQKQQLSPKVISSKKIRPFGYGYEVILDKSSKCYFELKGTGNCILVLDMVVEKTCTLKCSNPELVIDLKSGINHVKVPVAEKHLDNPFYFQINGLKRFYYSNFSISTVKRGANDWNV